MGGGGGEAQEIKWKKSILWSSGASYCLSYES